MMGNRIGAEDGAVSMYHSLASWTHFTPLYIGLVTFISFSVVIAIVQTSFPRFFPFGKTKMDEDEIVDVLPIHFSTRLDPGVQLHQFPLLTRSLQAPPAALASGKRITARIKPQVRKLEIHVPTDPRPDVWNADRAKQYGAAQVEDDHEKLQNKEDTESDPRLSEVRLKSEQIVQKGSYMLGIIRDGQSYSG